MKLRNEYIFFAAFILIAAYTYIMAFYNMYFAFIPNFVLNLIHVFLYLMFFISAFRYVRKTREQVSDEKQKTNIFISFLPPVVFSFYPLIHIYLLNLREVNFQMFASAGLFLTAFAAIVFGFYFLFYKNTEKSSVMCSLTIFLFFQYLIFEIYFNAAFFACTILFFAVLIYKIKIKNLFKTLLFLSSLLFFFNVSEIIKTGLSYIDFKQTPKHKTEKPAHPLKAKTMPDVYILLLDAYPSSAVLERDFNFDNSKFTDSLENRGFFVFKSIYSNYSRTILSIPAFLNHKFVYDLEETSSQAVNNAQLFKTAYNNGYKVSFINSFGAFKLTKGYIDTVKDIYQYYIVLNTPDDIFFGHSLFKKMYVVFNKNKTVNDLFWKILKTETEKPSPKFVFAHVMAPHLPYLKDSSGKDTDLLQKRDILVNGMKNEYKINKKSCIEYLIYTNNQTEKTVDEILKKTNNNAYIIILGDHGLRLHYFEEKTNRHLSDLYPEKNVMNSFFNTFLAFYSPNRDYEKYKDNTTLMNFFISFSNNIFGTNYQKQPEKFYFVFFNQSDAKLKDISKNTKLFKKSEIEYTR